MDYTVAIIVGLVAFVICHLAGPIGEALRLIDRPDGRRKLHARATPLVGGLAIAVPVRGAAIWQAAVTEFSPLHATFGVLVFAFMLLGMADDRHHISPAWRLAVALAICVGVMTAVPGLRVDYLRFSFIYRVFLLDAWSTFFTLLCLIGLVNALNMADGKNGLLTGLGLFLTAMLGAKAPAHVVPLLLALGAALAVVFAFNLTGRVFLGDSGSYALGALFGFLAIHVHDARADWLPSDSIALWFLIPVIDCLRLMATRILLGKSPFSSDRNHLHHVLEDAMPWRVGLVVYLTLSIAPALAAEIAPRYTLLWAMIALGIYVGLIALLPRVARTSRRPSDA